jgi:hypothetical protein
MKPGTGKRAAEALAEYYSSPHPRKKAFTATCEKYEIRSRTLQRWLRDIDTDTELARQVNELRAPSAIAFADRLAQTKQKFLDGLEKSYEELKTSTPDALRVKSEALRTIADIERTDQVAAAILNQAAQSYPFGQPRPDGRRPAVVQRLSDEQLSERKPGERDGEGSLRAAA